MGSDDEFQCVGFLGPSRMSSCSHSSAHSKFIKQKQKRDTLAMTQMDSLERQEMHFDRGRVSFVMFLNKIFVEIISLGSDWLLF